MVIWSDVELGPDICRPLAALIGRFLAGEAAVALQRTRGLAAVLADYEKHYGERVRRQGRLTFDDVKILLARGLPDGRLLGQCEGDMPERRWQWISGSMRDSTTG